MADIIEKSVSFRQENDIWYIGSSSASRARVLKSSSFGYKTGIYEGGDLEETLGLLPMEGCDNPNSDNYGNYYNSDGSIFCFIPKFYYTFNCKPEETYYQDTLKYSGLTAEQLAQIATRSPLNYMAIVSGNVFANEAEANKHGFILHRAFIDGGVEKSGFFIMKYLASKGTDGTSNKALSVKNGKTISLSSISKYISSGNMPNCSGMFKDAIILSKAINPNLNCASVFMYSALAMQSKFIGTIVTSTDQCAWYDSNLVTNFPKGCNSGFLRDIDDSSVGYIEQYDDKPLTGSGTPFAKTTHNGLNNGVCDLNGCIWQITTGIGWAGSRVLKESSKLSDIEASTVDNQSAFYYDTTSEGITTNTCWGNISSTSWRKAINGVSRALEGVFPKTDSGMSSNGTNEFGADYVNYDTYFSAVASSALPRQESGAGVFSRGCADWLFGDSHWGFRSGGYAS